MRKQQGLTEGLHEAFASGRGPKTKLARAAKSGHSCSNKKGQENEISFLYTMLQLRGAGLTKCRAFCDKHI